MGPAAADALSLPGAERWLGRDAESGKPALSEAMVRFAARYEVAREVEDVLARRCRLLFLDAAEATRQADAGAVAVAVASAVGATILSEELDRDVATGGFMQLATLYQRLP